MAQRMKRKEEKDFAFSAEICSFSLRIFFILLLFCVDAYVLRTAWHTGTVLRQGVIYVYFFMSYCYRLRKCSYDVKI